MIQENRRAERIAIKLPVSVSLADDKTGSVLAGPVQEVVELTFGSMSLKTYHYEQDGTLDSVQTVGWDFNSGGPGNCRVPPPL